MKEQVWIGLWSNFRRRALRCFLYAAMMGMSLGLSSFASFRGQEIGSFVVRNSTLKDALKQLEKQVDVGFFYDAKDVEKVRDITLNISNATLENVLSRLFAGTGFTYEILDDNVVITREKVVVEQKSIPMQKIKITVRDADSGESLIGATAIIRGTTIGGAADIDGVIVLDAVPENAVIDVKFLGKKSVEVKVVKGKTEYTVSLKDEALQFDEVVVTGYQTIERGRATGSFEVVRNKDLEMVVSNDVADKLEGVVPGLAVDGNGDMLIRGQATIYAETKPLVVVDGFPMEYGTVNINPNDIEQISVLKDAAAASIWGVRAANGVIVITTKKGKKNQPVTVSYTGNVKIGSKFDVSSLGRLNSRQWIDWEREQFFYRPSDIANIGTSYGSFTEAALIEYRYQNGQLDEAGRDAAYEQLGSYDNSRDIEKYFYRNSLLHSHNLVISGGSERMTNYFSVNYENKLGDLIGNSTDHVTVQLNSTMELFKRVSLLAGVRANYDNTEAYTLKPTWDKVANADFYEIDFMNMLYTTIKDTELLFGDLTPETPYSFKIRAVNKDGASAWTEFGAATKSDPLEFAIRGIRGECTAASQGRVGVKRLFDFVESGDIWHSKYGEKAVPFELVMDLVTVNQLDKFHYLPRTNAGNGTLLKGTVSYSMNKELWTEAGTFEWQRDDEVKVFNFTQHPTARYIKLSVTEAVGNYGSGKEIYVFKVPGTESYLQGDINADGKIDGNDLTSYTNYTGLRKGDSDFEGYISNGDINKNGLIDAYDISVVATQLEGGVDNRGTEKVDGTIEISTSKQVYDKDEIIEIQVKGVDLRAVNAFSFALPYNQQDYEFVGVELQHMNAMENLTYDRLHSNGSKALYPTFVNVGNKKTLEGTVDLFLLKFKAKRQVKFGLKIIDGLLVDKRLNTRRSGVQ